MKLDPDNWQVLKHRLNDLYDGEVRDVKLDLCANPSVCTVSIVCKDYDGDSEWVLVRFRILNLSSFRFDTTVRPFNGLASGIQIYWEDGRVHFVLDAFPYDEPKKPDLLTNEAFVVGTECLWEAEDFFPD